MKKVIFILILFFGFISLAACSNDEYETYEAIIVSKEYKDKVYWFHIKYEMEHFDEPLTASVTVKKSVYDAYEVGDMYLFKRPVFKLL